MKRLATLLLAVAGLIALLASCGGGEEAGILAVAFRLEEGSPVMVAYIGDPVEDPFELQPGRYYIEALDQDGVLLSLGAVDIEDGDVVDFSPDFEAAGGVADAERGEPLITLASFLIDVELADYTFLEIVTGGFTESPFDPALELDTADFDRLLEIYDEIAAQEDAVMAALSRVEGRAEVSLGVLYVRSPWVPAPQLFGGCHQAVGSYYDSLYGCEADGGLAGFIDTCEPMRWRTRAEIELRAQVYEKWKRAEDAGRRLRELQGEWREYASGLAAPEGRAALEERIKRDLGSLLHAADDPARARVRDRLTESFVNRVARENPHLRRTPTPTPSPTPKPTPTAVPTPTPTPEPEPAVTPTPTPEATETPTPEATESPTPTPEPMETPAPEAQELTAMGKWDQPLEEGCTVEQHTMTLKFDTGGGDGSVKKGSEAHLRQTCDQWEQCPPNTSSMDWYFQGTYSPDSKKFRGIVQWWWEADLYQPHDEDDEDSECDHTGIRTNTPTTLQWEATLGEDGVVSGTVDFSVPQWGVDEVLQFELTVQS